MATATKSRSKAVAKRDDEFEEDRALAAAGLTAIREHADVERPEQNLSDVLAVVAPEAQETDLASIVGKTIVITEWGIQPGRAEFAKDGRPAKFAVLIYHLADDKKKTARFSSCGGVMIVDAVERAIQARVLSGGPVRATIGTYPTKFANDGYRFVRDGEPVRKK